ncbi:bifunctional DNA primase/polymerase [Leptolyngbyaceae cyanobacterium UHCC 1019]
MDEQKSAIAQSSDRPSNNFKSSSDSNLKLPFLPTDWNFCRVRKGTKKPIDQGWQDNTLTTDQIRLWVEQGENYGVVWGGTAIGLDVDGSAPHQKLQEIAAGRTIPPTVAWTSGVPGRYHLAFHLTLEQKALLTAAAQKTRSKSPQGRWVVSCVAEDNKASQLEFRWSNHQSVLPPSLHPSGRRYDWLSKQSPAEQDPADLPDWLFSYLIGVVQGETEERSDLSSLLSSEVSTAKIPLERLLRKKERSWIKDGLPDGIRNDSGAALARNLIGTANYLNSEGIAFEDNPKKLFEMFCDRCQPPINPEERSSIWNSAERSDPQPALTPDAIANCITAWERKGEEFDFDVEKPGKTTTKEDKKTSIVELLLAITGDLTLFHTPDRIAYADVWLNQCRQTILVRSRQFKQFLAYQLYALHERAAASEPINTVLNLLQAKANFEGEERQVYIRLAEFESKIYLDLGTDAWTAVEIDSQGWQVVSDYPVRFRRPNTLLGLTEPVANNSLKDLWQLLNVIEEDQVLVDAVLKVKG